MWISGDKRAEEISRDHLLHKQFQALGLETVEQPPEEGASWWIWWTVTAATAGAPGGTGSLPVQGQLRTTGTDRLQRSTWSLLCSQRWLRSLGLQDSTGIWGVWSGASDLQAAPGAIKRDPRVPLCRVLAWETLIVAAWIHSWPCGPWTEGLPALGGVIESCCWTTKDSGILDL